MKKKELKSCPFCGETESLKLWGEEEVGYVESNGYIQVVCNVLNYGCGASSLWSLNEKEAIKAWNTRA